MENKDTDKAWPLTSPNKLPQMKKYTHRPIEALAEAVQVKLTDEEIRRLETVADEAKVKIMGPDLFRPFVLKERR